MLAASNHYKKNLPDELEQMVFLSADRKSCELAKYIRVAHRVKVWIEPILYRKISIVSETQAQSLLYSLTVRPRLILYLRIGLSVSPGTVFMLLRRCPRLVDLALLGGETSLCRFHMILNALNNLAHLKYLSVNPTILFRTRYVHLPDTSAFHRVTHLDLIADLATGTIVNGAQYLRHLTHLSMTWKMSRAVTEGLRVLLRHPSYKLVLLWLDEIDRQEKAIKILLEYGLDDPRIVWLPRSNRSSMELNGGFWLHAKRIIAWRKENNITTMRRPTVQEDIASI